MSHWSKWCCCLFRFVHCVWSQQSN